MSAILSRPQCVELSKHLHDILEFEFQNCALSSYDMKWKYIYVFLGNLAH